MRFGRYHTGGFRIPHNHISIRARGNTTLKTYMCTISNINFIIFVTAFKQSEKLKRVRNTRSEPHALRKEVKQTTNKEMLLTPLRLEFGTSVIDLPERSTD